MHVKILLGPICAGKTTYSKYLQKVDGFTRFSQDDLRLMLYGRLGSDKKQDYFICSMIHGSILSLMPERSGEEIKVVIDGYPLDAAYLEYIARYCDNTEIIIFDVDLLTANIRNDYRRKTQGIYVKPSEIRRYNEEFKRFIDSPHFKHMVQSNKCTISNLNIKNMT